MGDFEPLCRLLSRKFSGEIWAFGSYDADVFLGRFRLRVVKERSSVHLMNLMRFGRHVAVWTEQLRRAAVTNLVVVAFDPFKGGLSALYTAWRARGALVCEVNGVYADRHNLRSGGSGWMRRWHLSFRRAVGGFVLRRASAVRLLFADQLRDFVCLPPEIIRRQFFDISNTERFYPGREESIVLGVGFPFRVKGFDVLCNAFRRIAPKYPEWKLVLIGHGVPEEARAGGFLDPQIQTRPGVLQTEVAQWMARCAIFALPSRTEAMGRVLIEAGAAGKCRVASRVDGIPTVVEDGVDGILVPPDDVEQLSVELERLILDGELRRRLGEAAKHRVAREFSANAYLQHYSDLVGAVISRPRKYLRESG